MAERSPSTIGKIARFVNEKDGVEGIDGARVQVIKDLFPEEIRLDHVKSLKATNYEFLT
jgi:hypothetical protein